MGEVTISIERFQQLIRAEHEANQLKAFLKDKFDTWGSFDREVQKTLCTLYCGVESE